MDFPDDQIAELKALFPGVARDDEGEQAFFLIPQLVLPDGCNPQQVDALLCPSARDGYPSRLFFAAQVASKRSRNWGKNEVRILERNWFAYSWKVKETLRLAQMVAAHLEALR